MQNSIRQPMMIIILISLCLTGCVKPRIIDDIRLVQARGYDYYQDHLLLGTITSPIFFQSTGSGIVQPKSDVMSVVVKKATEIDNQLESKSEYQIEPGKLLVSLYNSKIAADGLLQYVDILKRNPNISILTNLAVTQGSAREILQGHYASNSLVSEYLSDLFNKHANSNFPQTNMHTFLYQFSGDGMDPFLPLLKKKDKHIQIIGIALFKGDKYIDYIPYSQAFIFKMLYQSFRKGTYTLSSTVSKYVSIENISSKIDYRVIPQGINGHHPIIKISIKQNGYVKESSSLLQGKYSMINLQKALAKKLQKDGTLLVKHLQRLQTDPLGIGSHVRSFQRNWSKEAWKDYYPDADIRIKVKVTLKHEGIID